MCHVFALSVENYRSSTKLSEGSAESYQMLVGDEIRVTN